MTLLFTRFVTVVNHSALAVFQVAVDPNYTVVPTDKFTPTLINNNFGKTIEFYPNPSNGVVSFNLDVKSQENKLNVKVYNITGVLILSMEDKITQQNNTLDLSTLSNGAYLISIEYGNQLRRGKVILPK